MIIILKGHCGFTSEDKGFFLLTEAQDEYSWIIKFSR